MIASRLPELAEEALFLSRWLTLALFLVAGTSPAQHKATPSPTPVQQAKPTTSGNCSPGISNISGNSQIIIEYNNSTCGITKKELEEVLKASGGAQKAQIDDLSKKLNATNETVHLLLTTLSGSDVPMEQWPQKIVELAERYRNMLQQFDAVGSEDPESKALLDEARKVLKQAHSLADYDRVDALLAKVEDADLRSAQKATALEHDAREAEQKKKRRAAEIRAKRGELSLTRLDYLTAAQHFRIAAELAEYDSKLRVDYLNRYGMALYMQGNEKGDNASLIQAISVYQRIIDELARKEFPLEWAGMQNNLAAVLEKVAERESGNTRLGACPSIRL